MNTFWGGTENSSSSAVCVRLQIWANGRWLKQNYQYIVKMPELLVFFEIPTCREGNLIINTMLRTNNGQESAAYSLIYGADVRMWRSVGLELRIPYFVVTHEAKEEDGWLLDTCLMWAHADVLAFCRTASLGSDMRNVRFSMLLPAKGDSGWRMEEIGEIWTDSKKQGARPLVFIGINGQRLDSGGRASKFSTRTRERVFFRANQVACEAVRC
ncbi:hypothetical protein [Duganella sp. HH105]|uniref:hypothetical protein n=1 Tax=Duganella sp. HH105 TaxID=1781067 RepID=UPI000893D047|nr:hypothetical protein [Duganella sp. HH105]OEZ54234.1 hypothetical protein DUGA6_58690 [Duganella sp. HH105]